MNNNTTFTTDQLRKLVQAAFDEEGLLILCFDYFQAVYKRFFPGQTRGQQAQLLVNYAEKQRQVNELLALIQAANPGVYDDFQRQHSRATPPSFVSAPTAQSPGPAAATQHHSCFISYSSQDEAFAAKLYHDLQQAEVQCWYAPEDMKIGAPIRTTLDESVWEQSKLLLVLSEHSIVSNWVESEVETALDKERLAGELVLFPIRLDDSVMRSRIGWAAHIRRTRYIGDFSQWREPEAYQRALNRLLRDLQDSG